MNSPSRSAPLHLSYITISRAGLLFYPFLKRIRIICHLLYLILYHVTVRTTNKLQISRSKCFLPPRCLNLQSLLTSINSKSILGILQTTIAWKPWHRWTSRSDLPSGRSYLQTTIQHLSTIRFSMKQDCSEIYLLMYV